MCSFTIDAGGFVRTLDRFPTSVTMFPDALTRLVPSQYVSFHKPSKTELYFHIAEPDVPSESTALAVKFENSSLRLRWPLTSSAYHLQESGDLNSPFISST